MIHYIDDEAMIRDLLGKFIAIAGYKSIGFESGEAYLDYLNSTHFKTPTVIISDVSMPGINGYDLTLEIRKKYPLQKIILCTGNPDEQNHPHAAQQLYYTLDKPFKPEKLISILNTLSSCEEAHIAGMKKQLY